MLENCGNNWMTVVHLRSRISVRTAAGVASYQNQDSIGFVSLAMPTSPKINCTCVLITESYAPGSSSPPQNSCQTNHLRLDDGYMIKFDPQEFTEFLASNISM